MVRERPDGPARCCDAIEKGLRALPVIGAAITVICLALVMPAAALTTFSGSVLEAGERPAGAAVVSVTLSCSSNPVDTGSFVSMASTGAAGEFSLEGPDSCEFFNILLTVPDGREAQEASSAGGTVISPAWIQYSLPLAQKPLNGNIFLLQPVAGTGTGTSCPEGCTCLGSEEAQRRYQYPERCGEEPCGGLRSAGLWYCFHEGTPLPPPVPAGNLPPEARISLLPQSGPAPLSVACSGSGSSDPDGSIVSYAWDFGDGTTGTGMAVSHEFALSGDYTVTLTVADDRGAPGSAREQVQVTAAMAPSPSSPPPGEAVSYSVEPERFRPGDRITVRAWYDQDVQEPVIAILVNGNEVTRCEAASCEYAGGPYASGPDVAIRFRDASGVTRFIPEDKNPQAPVPDQPDCDEMVTTQLSPELKPFSQCAGDGYPGPVDNCPKKVNKDQKDTDKDGVGDACDNCPATPNPDQADADADGTGNLCETCNGYPDRADIDSDGEPDGCDCDDRFSGPAEQDADCGGPCLPCDPCTASALPASFDWRDWRGIDWVTPVKDQAQCGSCWAFGPAGAVEARYNIEKGKPALPPLDLSEQYLVSYHVNPGTKVPGCCRGGLEGRALVEIRDAGVIAEAQFPYQSGGCLLSETGPAAAGCNMSRPGAECRCTATGCTTDYCDPGCAYIVQGRFIACTKPTLRPSFGAEIPRWRIGSFSRPTTGTGTYAQLGNDVKRAILCDGPLTAGTDVWPGGGHVVLMTGWDDTWDGSTGAWIIKNSWGANWIAGGDFGSAGPGYAFVPYNGPVGDLVNWTFGVRTVTVVP